MPARMAITRRATRRRAPISSPHGCPATTARASCIATCPGIWRCSRWRAATRIVPARSMPMRSARRFRTPPLFNLADAASFLWRWRIYEETPSLDGEWPEVAGYAGQFFPNAAPPFADAHAALAAAATGDEAAARLRVAQLKEREESGRLPQGPVVAALCAGAA